MKIRQQFITIEVALTLSLFLSLLLTVSSLVDSMGLEDLKIKTAALQASASRVRYSAVSMLTSIETDGFLVFEYEQLTNQLTQELDEIQESRLFKKLPLEAEQLFKVIQSNWANSIGTLPAQQIPELLQLREKSPTGLTGSISYIQGIIAKDPNLTGEYSIRLKLATDKLSQLERNMNMFELHLGEGLNKMSEITNRYRQVWLFEAFAIPALVLVLALAGTIFFANFYSRKLKILDKALAEVAGGDFSTRIEVKGNDEFTSLSTSINAFTRTLGAKLESFRLIMHDMGHSLISSLDSSQVEQTLVRLALKDSGADGAAMYKVGGDAGELILTTLEGRFRPPFKVMDLPGSPAEEDIEAILHARIISPGQTILGESAATGEAVFIRNVPTRSGLDWERSEEDALFISSLIVVPLRVGTTVLGVLSITISEAGRYFSDLEYTNMQSFAELAAITLDNIYKYADVLEASQLNRELGIAEEIQKDLIPTRLPRLPNGEVAYLSRSIKGLNGDYFDVYPLGGGKTMIAICEVAGRGVPAGLVMVMIRTVLRLLASPEKDARTIMTQLNEDMTQRIAIENYASVAIVVLDADGSFTFSSAAHYPLQVLRNGTSKYEEIQTEGIPVGIDKDAHYLQVEGTLSQGDLALFHTDGVPESRDREGRLFGVESLQKVVVSESSSSPREIVESLKTELEYFERGTDQKDDQTVIILKYTGGNVA